MMQAATLSSIPTTNNAYSKIGYHYVGELADLYNRYLLEKKQEVSQKLLVKKIEEINAAIQGYVDEREKFSYTLFCVDNYDAAIDKVNSVRQNIELLASTLSLVIKLTTTDKKFSKLISSSIEVLQEFTIKLIEHSSLFNELKSFEGTIDENSKEYSDKMEEIVNIIEQKGRRKVGNSLKELIAV
jgi:hypothetical protein